MNSESLVSISLVVLNGEKYIRECMKAVFAQMYSNIEVVVWDNDSKDKTVEILEKEFPKAHIITHEKNYGFEGGQDANFKNLKGEYVVFLSVDVVLDKNFILEAVREAEKNPDAGALQAKILTYNSKVLSDRTLITKTNIIDTTGFEIFRSRRVVNRGHGEEDTGQFEKVEEIFSYEGAAGFFKREALESVRVSGYIFDEDFWWYASDLDLGWRLRLLGWKSLYVPSMVCWHERSTTHRLSSGMRDFIRLRKTIPGFKRALDYRNTHFTLLKNEFVGNMVRDIVPFVIRETKLFLYTLVFEPRTVFSWGSFFLLLPRMIKKRGDIMGRKKVSREEMRAWYKM